MHTILLQQGQPKTGLCPNPNTIKDNDTLKTNQTPHFCFVQHDLTTQEHMPTPNITPTQHPKALHTVKHK